MLARYTQGAGIDEPLAEVRSGTTSYYDQDGLGSVTSLSGSTGSLVSTYVYDTFGNLTTSSGGVTNPFQYTGRDYDPETGLRYYRARYYSADTGRFLSEDPIGSLSARPNFYLYGRNEPTLFNDPSGLCPPNPTDIFREAENEALRRLADPRCAAAFNGLGPARIRATNYRRMPARAVRIPDWDAATLGPTLVYINKESSFYNYAPGTVYHYVDPLTRPNTAYNLPVGAIGNAEVLLHELLHQLNLDVNDAPNGVVNDNAELANDLYVLRNCFLDLRVPLP